MTDLRARRMKGEQWVLEPRTADPATTLEGERWIRSDLDSGDKIATLRVDVGNSILDVPIFSTGTAVETVSEALRVEVNGVTGYVPIAPTPDAAYPELRMQHNSEVYGFHDRVGPGSAIPDSEGFEYNDLTGVYGGDTGGFEIQTGTVFEGQYALAHTQIDTNSWIVRDESPFSRSGLRVDWDIYLPAAENGGGIAFSTAVSGRDAANGYQIFLSDSETQLYRLDDASGLILDEASGSNPTDSWESGTVEFSTNGEIIVEFGGETLSATDTTYTDLLLSAAGFSPFYVDSIQFSEI